jgi:hypothetical protein
VARAMTEAIAKVFMMINEDVVRVLVYNLIRIETMGDAAIIHERDVASSLSKAVVRISAGAVMQGSPQSAVIHHIQWHEYTQIFVAPSGEAAGCGGISTSNPHSQGLTPALQMGLYETKELLPRTIKFEFNNLQNPRARFALTRTKRASRYSVVAIGQCYVWSSDSDIQHPTLDRGDN